AGAAFDVAGERLAAWPGLEVSPDGSRISGARGPLVAWDVRAGKELFRRPDHTGGIFGAVFSRDGKLLAAAEGLDAVRVSQATTGAEGVTLRMERGGPVGAGFSPDGERLATVRTDGVVKLWDVTTGAEVLTLPRGPDDPPSRPGVFVPH